MKPAERNIYWKKDTFMRSFTTCDSLIYGLCDNHLSKDKDCFEPETIKFCEIKIAREYLKEQFK
jgi:hypothetical protein